jgi:hypothetical protein
VIDPNALKSASNCQCETLHKFNAAKPVTKRLVRTTRASEIGMAQLNMNSPDLRQLGWGNGVIHMGPLNVIRRMYLRQKLSIREIARRTG